METQPSLPRNNNLKVVVHCHDAPVKRSTMQVSKTATLYVPYDCMYCCMWCYQLNIS